MKALVLPLALLAGCVTPDPAPRFTPAWEPFDPEGADWRTTRKALLVADCQFHNLYSRALPERNLAIKALVGTAIRPPQLDLFSRDVLSWILAQGAPEAEVVLHLGDAVDLACTGEFETFVEVMDGGKRPWFMAPGNHDSSRWHAMTASTAIARSPSMCGTCVDSGSVAGAGADVPGAAARAA